MAERYAVSYLRSGRGWFDTSALALDSRSALTMRDLLPPGRLGDLAVRVPGDRYLGLRAKLRDAQIVHSQELGYWYSMQAARLKRRLGFRLVLTVWETIPLLDAYRNVRTRGYRRETIAATDLFLAVTERARTSLLLEGAPAERIRVCPPGVATDRFGAGASSRDVHSGEATPSGSPGAGDPLARTPGVGEGPSGRPARRRNPPPGVSEGSRAPSPELRVWIVGTGPEERRLRAYASELGIADAVDFAGRSPTTRCRTSTPARTAWSFPACRPGPGRSSSGWCWRRRWLREPRSSPAARELSWRSPAPARASSPPGTGRRSRGCSTSSPTGPDDAGRAAAARERSALYSTAAAAERLAAAYDDLLAGRLG